MDKNGQNRGGRRVGSGRRSEPATPFEVVEGITEETRPEIPEYMIANQRTGELFAAAAYQRITSWLSSRGVLDFVPDHALQQYAMALGRWIQTENEVSRTGFLAAHPTTKAPITSPFVSMSIEYSRQAQASWWTIYQMIKDSTGGKIKPEDPTNSLIELLRKKAAEKDSNK